MPILVQKFGGTSVATPEKILAAARKAIRAQQEGNQVVVVVSAMGQNTDILIDLANEITTEPSNREMDMLLSTGEQVSVALMAMAVQRFGHAAISLTGGQIGIRTDSSFSKARIRSIATDRIKSLLDQGNIVIAAGFQGIDEDFNITTLGRGGSDTTAVALAAVLQASACEIFTDVDGVYTTDPRILPEARQVAQISYDEMLELASLGAGVMHNRSIEFAKKFGVPIRVRSSFSDAQGTMIVAQSESESAAVSGAALTRNEARLTIQKVVDRPGTSFEIFKRLADRKIDVDMIVQNVGSDGLANISFTVPENELKKALKALEEARDVVKASGISTDNDVAKVSVVGMGMSNQIGVAHQMFNAIAAAGINLQMISTSEIKISVLVDRASAEPALRTVHQAFGLSKLPSDAKSWSEDDYSKKSRSTPEQVIERLQYADMERLMLDDISLLDNQSRITLTGVPDRPGVAAEIFETVSKQGVFVDMIVQSYDGDAEVNSISFTIPRDQYDTCLKILSGMKDRVGQVTSSRDIAKLSVSGIGLRSHTSVAINMFEALAEKSINIQMINTSELRVNVVVDGAQGSAGLAALQEKFRSLQQI
jgi:aspartate kinase